MKKYKIFHRTEKRQVNLQKMEWEKVPCDDWVVEVNGLVGYFKTEQEAKKALADELRQETDFLKV